jgi:hypothetical protein
MNSELVESHLPGGHGATMGRANERLARLYVQGYSSEMAGGAGK